MAPVFRAARSGDARLEETPDETPQSTARPPAEGDAPWRRSFARRPGGRASRADRITRRRIAGRRIRRSANRRAVSGALCLALVAVGAAGHECRAVTASGGLRRADRRHGRPRPGAVPGAHDPRRAAGRRRRGGARHQHLRWARGRRGGDARRARGRARAHHCLRPPAGHLRRRAHRARRRDDRHGPRRHDRRGDAGRRRHRRAPGGRREDRCPTCARSSAPPRSAASARPLFAEAMVDADVEIAGVVDKGKLLTLTTAEALEHKVADFTRRHADAALAAAGPARRRGAARVADLGRDAGRGS